MTEFKVYNDTGYGLVPRSVMRNPELSFQAKAIYSYLSSFAGNTGRAFPSTSLMSKELDMSRDTLFKYLKELKEKKVITVERERTDKGTFDRNIYYLHNEVKKAPSPNLPDTVNPDTDKPDTVNYDTNSNNLNSNNLNTNNNTNNNTNYYVSKKFLNDVIEKWNSIEEITDVRKIIENTERYKNIARRIKETSEDEFLEVIDLVSKSRFLRGYNNNGWKVPNIDWILNKNKYYKILEGSYNDRNNNIKDNVSVENIPEQGKETKFGKTF